MKPLEYKVKHPLMAGRNHFNSWVELCDTCMEVAMEQAQKELMPRLMDLAEFLCDQIIDTVEEREPQADY